MTGGGGGGGGGGGDVEGGDGGGDVGGGGEEDRSIFGFEEGREEWVSISNMESEREEVGWVNKGVGPDSWAIGDMVDPGWTEE